ncbi:exosome non-catalytic core subunit [Maudiozyma humilis]|uniref:Ribosomal RNA-processing protein 43 n=1 Tax=Maudiozyma humilis TaxID=51915 RepID=A0AAV5RZ30_MAUHU|nr:exosome non-catalytic core subunit [Kazachstania humilis]
MSTEEEATVEVHPVSFPPEILARISPELSLQRHLSLGFRPSLRGFEEFRDVSVDVGTLSRYHQLQDPSSTKEVGTDNHVLGSCVLREGDVYVVTKITGGIIEDVTMSNEDIDEEEDAELLELTEDHSDITKYTSVYPVVEVERGRMGACTDEEMITSQKLFDTLQHAKILPKSSLKVKPGVRITNDDGTVEIIYPDSANSDEVMSSFKINKKWSYVLYARIEVFGRTGPVFDLCWNSLMYALKSVQLPKAFIDERATDLKMTVRTRGRNAIIRETYNLLCDPNDSTPIRLAEKNISFASTYGLIDLDPEADIANLEEDADGDEAMVDEEVKTVLLADIEGEAEESSIKSNITIVSNADGRFKRLSIVGGGAKITPALLAKSIALSKQRTADLAGKLI